MKIALTITINFLMLVEVVAQPTKSLRKEIEAMFHSAGGTFALAFCNLQSGKYLFINEREMFHAASTMKTPVMIEVFKQARQGKFRLDDSLVVKNEFRSIVDGSVFQLDAGDDSDSSMYKRVGDKATIRELIYHMITVSSNMATNLLIELVGPKNVMETMHSIEAKDIQVLRGVEDSKAFQQGMNNTTNAYDLMVVFRALAEGSLVDSSSCKVMLDILSDQKFREIIPALLPAGTHVAHKTGSITGVEHDSGIVFLPDGRKYVLVLLAKNLKNGKAGQKVMAKVSRKIFDAMMASD